MKILLIFTNPKNAGVIGNIVEEKDTFLCFHNLEYSHYDFDGLDLYDLVLVDDNIEEHKFNHVISIISDSSPKIPLIRISSQNDLNSTLSLLAAGVDGTLVLPSTAEIFRKTIHSIIGGVNTKNMEERVKLNGFVNGKEISVETTFFSLLNALNMAIEDSAELSKVVKQLRENKHILPKVSGKLGRVSAQGRKMEQEVEKALENNNFRVFYQPVIDLETNRLSGFETLIRWIKDDGTMVSPETFIPLAEETSAIHTISYFVFKSIIRDLQTWNSDYKLDRAFRINFNLSARLLDSNAFADYIIKTVKDFSIPASQIGIEITESALMGSLESANIFLLKLKSENFSLYMDDFGTGYSSLSYLQHFPFDVIKIDKSFVKWIGVDDMSEHIVASIVGLAHGLRMAVVGEGVEDPEHVDFLKKINCDYGQGFLFAEPMEVDKAELFLERYYERSGDV